MIKYEEQIKKCCLCGQSFIGWGNNPWPLNTDTEARCCDLCNDEKVTPARIEMAWRNKK